MDLGKGLMGWEVMQEERVTQMHYAHVRLSQSAVLIFKILLATQK